ncbi:MAG: hypothetical protein WAW39_25355 [Prosthecobacter sp.]|uniref:hypothetical protein n=1 Tax=Prosthecobacter sp. TaxID=1965333 RepID=UPI003BAE9F69
MIDIKVSHDLASFDLIYANLDVLAEALEFDAIKLVLIAKRIESLGNKFIWPGKITRSDGRLDEIAEFHRHVDGKLGHG